MDIVSWTIVCSKGNVHGPSVPWTIVCSSGTVHGQELRAPHKPGHACRIDTLDIHAGALTVHSPELGQIPRARCLALWLCRSWGAAQLSPQLPGCIERKMHTCMSIFQDGCVSSMLPSLLAQMVWDRLNAKFWRRNRDMAIRLAVQVRSVDIC